MEFFETIHKRRSIRKFKPEIFPDALVQKALAAAILAPNSSNTQTWDFHWVKTTEKKQKLIEYCLSQSAARTATQLLVVTANPTRWKRSQKPLIEWVKKANAPKMVQIYYEKLIPITYRWGFLNSLAIIRAIGFFITGLFRPIMRGPLGKRQLQEVAIKSAALACENFALAITAQGGATCMMEGFDEWRVKKLLQLDCHSRVVMVIGIGFEGERGTWGEQFRLPLEEVVHYH